MIYFVGAKGSNLVKIGYTSRHPNIRFSTLQIGSPVELVKIGLMAGNRRREAAIHKRFRADHSHGEWFRRSDAVCAYIAAKAEGWSGNHERFLTRSERLELEVSRATEVEVCRAAAILVRPDTGPPPDPDRFARSPRRCPSKDPFAMRPEAERRNSFDLKSLR